MLQGWNGVAGMPSANFTLTNMLVQMSSNVSQGWLVYQLWIYQAGDFQKYEGETSQNNIYKGKSQLFGVVMVRLPSVVMMDCLTKTGCIVTTNGATYLVLASDES